MKEQYPGTGGVQMVALAGWLQKCGFTIWDLGMELDYKRELGGRLVPRAEWARRVRAARSVVVELRQPSDEDADAHKLVLDISAKADGEASASAIPAATPAA